MRAQTCLEWFPFYPHDWNSSIDVRKMNAAERGLYICCLTHQAEDGAIPGDVEDLAVIVMLSLDSVTAAWPKVSRLFVPDPSKPGWLYNERLRAEQEDGQQRVARLSAQRTEAVKKRWAKHRAENTVVSENDTTVLQPNTTVIQTDTTGHNNTLQDNTIQSTLNTEGVRAVAPTTRKESPSDMLYRLLPISHQTTDVKQWIGEYFKMRTAAKMKALTERVIELRATEYAAFTPEAIAAAFKKAALNQHMGVFPELANKSAQDGRTAAKETPAQVTARIRAERAQRAAGTTGQVIINGQ